MNVLWYIPYFLLQRLVSLESWYTAQLCKVICVTAGLAIECQKRYLGLKGR